MDTGLSDLEKKKREDLIKSLAAESPEARKVRMMTYQLKLRRPGVKQLFGEHPLSNEEFQELEKYFRMSRRSI